MIWVQLIFFVITLILSIALAPKPKAPRAAAIDDFDFPTAEEGREIPVVFGEIDVRGPNVVWFGDLDITPIKKRSGFSSATVGYKYSLGFHLGLCHGPCDLVSHIEWNNKAVWDGALAANGFGVINNPDVFGGESRGGGVFGVFEVLFGEDTQTANSYLTAVFGETPPAFRGIMSFVWRGPTNGGSGYIGNTETVHPIAIRVRRILKGWEAAVWQSSLATLSARLMNPAHIVYQSLTDTRWGMGISTARINEASFLATAQALFDEGFGMSLLWNQSSTIEDFLQIVLNHINGSLSFRPDTGEYQLDLHRGDYVPGDLPEYTAADVIDLQKFEKQGIGENVNEVSLTYTDPDTRLPTTIVAQDLANIDSQGARLPVAIDLKGIQDHDIAERALARELAIRTTPLTKITFTVNRRAWAVGFGSLFRFTWPARQCYERVFRVLRISKGTLQDNAITVEALEDIYQHVMGTGVVSQPVSGLPTPPPTPPTTDNLSNSVISATLTTPPSGSPGPQDGDRYYVPVGATGAWAGHDGELAEWDTYLSPPGWVFTEIPEGTIFYIESSPPSTVQVIGGVLVTLGGMGDPGSSGYVVRTALNTTVARTLTGSARISVSNGSGVGGDSVFDMVPFGSPNPAGSYTAPDITVDAYGRVTEAASGIGGGAPADADYLVGTAHAGLSGEIAVGTTPGGELGGTWAAPTVDATHSGSSHAAVQAAAEATAAAALAAHIADASAAHAASAIAFTPHGSIAATDVQAAIQEVRDEAGGGAPTDADYLVGTAHAGLSGEIAVGTTPGGELGGTWAAPTVDATHSGSSHAAVQAAAEATAAAALAAHLADTGDAHDASAISVDSTTLVGTGTDVQAVFEELDNAIVAAEGSIAAHIADATAAHAASAIAFTPNGSIAATDVQAAIQEVRDEATGGAVATDAIWDAKGDLAGGTGANTAARLAVGTNTHVLTADSAEATGMKWAAAAGGGAVATDAIWDVKGDLAGGTGANTAARLPVGTNTHVLTADSAEATGMKWVANVNDFHEQSSAPTAVNGRSWLDTDVGILYTYSTAQSAWVEL